MHTEALPATSGELLAILTSRRAAEFRGWVLAGETGLALQLGHRISEDFDFFRTHGLNTEALFERLSEVATCDTLYSDERTLSVLIDGVKLSFFQVREPFLFPAAPYTFFEVADIRDIALMKLLAVTNRGSRKDFVDLFADRSHSQRLPATAAAQVWTGPFESLSGNDEPDVLRRRRSRADAVYACPF